MDYKRNYILSYLVMNALFIILHFFTNVFKYTSKNKFSSFLMSIYSLGGIVNIAFIIQYVNMLKAKKCECSESIYREIMYIVAIIDALVLGLAFLLFFIVILYSSTYNLKNNYKKKRKVK
jgi:apolipoprotein N-acyltransferase